MKTERITVIRYFNLACAVMCFWQYAYGQNLITVCIGALNLAVFIFGKQLLEFFKKDIK